jgi:glycosyltransferase involved in cell wall biosynthesis
MIVKNEAEVLARCLDSIVDMMDEVIIVDTGSSDGTKEIAAEYTEQVYDFTWIDDFAAARNFAFTKAKCDYIYSADADEVMDEANRRHFKELKARLDGEIEIVQMYYANQLEQGTVYNYDREYRPKLFKRERGFVWIDPIHETIRTEPVVFDSEIEIRHLPKETHAKRDFAIFLRTINDGKPLSKRLRGMYARELFIAGDMEDFQAAEPYFEMLLQEAIDLEQVKEAACVVARAARQRGEIAKFFKFALKDIGSEGCSEMCCELGDYYRSHGDLEEAVIWYYNAAFETTSILNVKLSSIVPLTALVECYQALGNHEVAAEYEAMLRA